MRRGAPLLLVLVGLLLGAPARGQMVYVLNSGDASISILDAGMKLEIRRVPTLREPHHLVLTPDRRFLVVADSAGNELMFLDPATGETLRRERISNPYHLEYSPDGKWLVIASLRRDQVDVYDVTAGYDQPARLAHRLRVGDKPSHLAFSPDSRVVHVTLQGARAVLAISLETGAPLWQAEVGPDPASILWHEVPGVGPRLIVGLMGTDHFAVLDPATRQVERTIPVGRGAHTVFPSPDGRTLWLTSRVDSRVTAVDPATLLPRRVYDIPGGPDDLAFDPEGRVWMTLRWAARVGVLDPESGQYEVARVGRSPHGILVHHRAPPGASPTPMAAMPAGPIPVLGPAAAVPPVAPAMYRVPVQPAAAPAGR
jgi:DNA-binding beta-propeller fold protein YncE